jgi:hypothetical protein
MSLNCRYVREICELNSHLLYADFHLKVSHTIKTHESWIRSNSYCFTYNNYLHA